jgi:hypothetical protein
MPRCESSLQHLLVTLEGLPLLKSLETNVNGSTFAVPVDMSQSDLAEYMANSRKEQTEKAAKLIEENYARFEHLKVDHSFA